MNIDQLHLEGGREEGGREGGRRGREEERDGGREGGEGGENVHVIGCMKEVYSSKEGQRNVQE